MEDSFKTIAKFSGEHLYKIKNSKFFSHAYPVTSVEEIKELLTKIKKEHYQARHWCYAWRLGTDPIQYRANDDGEPNNSAGIAIYGQIQSFELTNVLVAVVRIFGGVKLGVGGLISSYRAGAQLALESSNIIEKIITKQFQLSFSYADMDKVMRIVKQKQLEIISQKLEMDCQLLLLVRKSEAEAVFSIFKSMHTIHIKSKLQ